MRILHVTPTYIPAYRYGGPILSVHGLCRALAARGHDVHVFTTSADGPGNSDVPHDKAVSLDGVKIRYFRATHPRRLFRAPTMAEALEARIGSFDLLHLHTLYNWPTAVAGRAAREHDVPYLLAPRGMLVRDLIRRKSRWIKTFWLALHDRANLAGAAALHMTSAVEQDDARQFGFRLPPLVVVPNAVELDDPAADGEVAPAILELRDLARLEPLVLFLGRVNWKKGLDRLVQAMAHVPRAHLAIAGNDEEDYTRVVEQAANAAGVHDRVHFTGFVGPADKRTLLRAAGLLVLPSYNENFGNVVLEALAERCPVVVTPEVGAADVVRDTGAGIVVDGDPTLLGQAIRDLLDDPAQRERMGQIGRAAIEARFSWPAIAASMEQVYTDVLAGTC